MLVSFIPIYTFFLSSYFFNIAEFAVLAAAGAANAVVPPALVAAEVAAAVAPPALPLVAAPAAESTGEAAGKLAHLYAFLYICVCNAFFSFIF